MKAYLQDWIDRTRYHEFSAAAVGACVLNIVFVGVFDWAARQTIQGQVIPGAEFWTEAALKAQPNCPPIRFIYNFERPVDVVTINTTWQTWARAAMVKLGAPDQAAYDATWATRYYNAAQRTKYGTDWSITLYIYNGDAGDDDDNFNNDSFALLSTTDAWGVGRMRLLIAHEIGHCFGALDGYSFQYFTTAPAGIFSTPNSLRNDIMGDGAHLQSSFDNLVLLPPTLGQVGLLSANRTQWDALLPVGVAPPPVAPPPVVTQPPGVVPAVLTGAVIGTAGAFNNGTVNTKDKVDDGNTSTFFDAPTASGAWTGLDFGSAKVITSIWFFPRAGKESRMIGGKFQGSNDLTTWSDINVVSNAPADAWNTLEAVSYPAGFRYVRYLGPAGSYDNVAEIEFYGR